MLHDRDLSARAEIVAAQLDALFDSLPSGYECDKQLATFNDSYTYGEIQTRDIAVIAHNVTEPAQLTFAELGSGLGKFAIAAGFFFKHSFGIEFAPERSAVAQRALVALGERAPPNVALTTGDLREFPLHCIDVVFAHNLVFSSGLERALELKLDCELADGAHVFSVALLRYSKRARILAEHNAFYNWATDELPRPLYHYTMNGEAIAWPEDDE